MLQWARTNRCEWDAATCEAAARGGHLELLQWAQDNGCEVETRRGGQTIDVTAIDMRVQLREVTVTSARGLHSRLC